LEGGKIKANDQLGLKLGLINDDLKEKLVLLGALF